MLVIVAGGEITDYGWIKAQIAGADYIICADGGTRHASALKLTPQLIIGDMDSIDKEVLQSYRQWGTKIKHYPREKDEVDTELAIMEGVKLGYKDILLVGATGGRLDHTLANIHLISKAATEGIRVTIIDEHHRLYIITPQIPAHIKGAVGDVISLIPITERVTGVHSQGLKWELNDRTFTLGHPFGISNELVAPTARVEVEQGLLLVVELHNPPTLK